MLEHLRLDGHGRSPIRGRQAAFNAASRDQWDGFSAHRRKVSALLGAGASPRPTRLCVLGAGNCNDLDLPALLDAHREVHLVDLDAEALDRGVTRQGVINHPSLRRHGGVDLTGCLDAIATWSPLTPIGPADLAALSDWPADRVGKALPGPFDRVASTCLLTQLIDTASHSLGDGHSQFGAVIRAIRSGHLRLLARLASSQSEAVLVNDVVSSDTFPTLSSFPEPDLPDLLIRLANAGNFIQGAHPKALITALRADPALCSKVTSLESTPPWLWRLHARHYLVWALTFRMGVRLGR